MYGKNDNLGPKAGKTQISNFKMKIKFLFCFDFVVGIVLVKIDPQNSKVDQDKKN